MLAGGWALLMPVAHMHCLHVSSVAGSLRWQSCGHATGLCSGVCLETLATESGVHDRHWIESRKSWWLSGFVRQNRTFPPLIRIQKCWLFAHQNMQKPLYTDVIDQNIDNIYLCSWCRSTEVWLYSIIWGSSSVLESPVFCSYGEKFVAYWSDQLGWHGEICAATVATQQQLKGPGSLHTPLANNNFQGSMQRTRSF